jgi:hypothetical protein
MTHMTQGRDRWRRGQRRSVQTRTVVARAVTRAKRLALGLALVAVVMTSALVGFSSTPAEADYIWWQGYVHNYEWYSWYYYCTEYGGLPYSGDFPGLYDDGSLCLAGIECPWVFIGCDIPY